MNVEEIARAYVACIKLEDKIQVEAPGLEAEVSELRSDLHALLMAALRENNIAYSDRAHAAQIAFSLVERSAV